MNAGRRLGDFLARFRDDAAGSSAVITALGMVVIIGSAALAVDLGMLASGKSEAQRAADAGARAGAFELIYHPNDAQQAQDTAIHVASQNLVRKEFAEVLPEDVTVDLTEKTVTVEVRRGSDRGNGITGFFAGIFGLGELGVRADATARVWPSMGGKCLLPTAVPDKWIEDESTGEEAGPNDSWDPENDGDCYHCANNSGYELYDPITLYPGQGGSNSFEPGWWQLWNPAQDQGASEMKDWVMGCPDTDAIHFEGETLTDKNGANTSIVNEFKKLETLYPDASWTGSGVTGTDAYNRIRPIVLFDPSTYTKVGNDTNFEILKFAGVFIQGVTGNQVNAYIVEFPGFIPAPDPNTPSFGKVVVLVE